MKKLILSLTLVACAAASALAQAQDEKPKRPAAANGAGARAGGGARMSPDDRLKMLTASLGLNQEQQDKVKKIVDEGKADFDKIRGLPQEERRPKFRDLTQKQNDKIAEVLTPEQKEKFKTAMAQGRANRAAGGGAAGAGGDANAPKKEGEKPADKKQ